MKERDILFEAGRFWVAKINGAFHVMATGATVSVTESAYADQSLAEARAGYLAKRETELGRRLAV